MNSSEPATGELLQASGRGRFRRFLAGVRVRLWVLVPLVCALALERSVSTKPWYDLIGYPEMTRLTGGARIRGLFLGSSLALAAIDVRSFEKRMAERGYRGFTSVNLAAGGSRIHAHALGVRTLLEQDRKALEGVAVFVEAPGGLPPPDTWKDPWDYPQTAWYLVRYLRLEDLPEFWRSRMPWGDRIDLSIRLTFQRSILVTYRQIVRHHALEWVQGGLREALTGIGGPWHGDEFLACHDDMTTEGGLLTRPLDIQRYRRYAETWVRNDMAFQRAVDAWDDTVVADLVRRVQAAGGRVIFFEVPQHSLLSPMYETPIRRRDRARFVEASARWGTPVVSPHVAVTDGDFPDSMHLRKSKAIEFTKALVDAWLDSRPFVAPPP